MVSSIWNFSFKLQNKLFLTVEKIVTYRDEINDFKTYPDKYKGDSIIAITVLSPTAVTSLSIYNLIVIVKSVTDDKYILLFNL